MALSVYRKGSSYVSNDHYLLLFYDGKAYAAGNVYSSTQRIISATFRYSRSGTTLTSATSRAKLSGCRWSPGSVQQRSVTDSLGLNDPKTQFHYSFGSVHPSAC